MLNGLQRYAAYHAGVMRLSTITNWAYGATVALTLLSGATMLLASGAERTERAAVAQRAQFDQLTASLEEDVYRLSEQARSYVVTGNPSHLIAYRRERGALGSVEARIRHLKHAGAGQAELGALAEAIRWADALTQEQDVALRAAAAGRTAMARQILFGDEYGRELDRIAAQVTRFQYMLDERTERAVDIATDRARLWRSASEIMLGMTALLFLCVLYFILRRRILHPVVRLSDVVTRLAAQDYAAIPPDLRQVDEIGDMAQAIRIFRENGMERQRLERERERNRAMRDLLSRMTQRLQGCDSMDDLAEVVRRFTPEIAPLFAGRLFVLDSAGGMMRETCRWGEPARSPHDFAPGACWALRRGQTHRPAGEIIDIACDHLDGPPVEGSLCIPLIAQGESIGLLYLERVGAASAEDIARAENYVGILAENIGLALSNLRLRDALRAMAMADALTGLANRRHFDEVLRFQLEQAGHRGSPLSCMIIDIDHFKQFNDDYGHDAGDAVLQAVGGVLGSALREKGFAFRLGGEEFVLLMPGMDVDQAFERAQQVQGDLRALRVEHRGKPLGPVTASFGVATSPTHGPADRLVRTADAALLRAKREGRDRIVVAAARRDMASHAA